MFTQKKTKPKRLQLFKPEIKSQYLRLSLVKFESVLVYFLPIFLK